MRDQTRVNRRVRNVSALEAGHVDAQVATDQLSVFYQNVTGSKFYGAQVMIEEIATHPFNNASRWIDFEATRRQLDRRTSLGFAALCFPTF
jgi:hypothetical protein